MADETTDLGTLLGEVKALRLALSALDGRLCTLETTQGPHSDRSMRATLQCPACGHREVLYATEVLDEADAGRRQAMALRRPQWWRPRTEGAFQAYICNSCGLVEWRTDPTTITPNGEKVQLLTGVTPKDASKGPYR